MENWPPGIVDDLPAVRGVKPPAQLPDEALTWDFDGVFCGVRSASLELDRGDVLFRETSYV